MSKIKIETVVVGFLFDAQVWLEGQETKLAYDGNDTRKSTDIVDVNDNELNITFHAVGVAGTDWHLTINELAPREKGIICPGRPHQVYWTQLDYGLSSTLRGGSVMIIVSQPDSPKRPYLHVK